jgi:hypothetical protein
MEREFGFLKHRMGLTAIGVRGIERVRLHADPILLARLARRRSAEREGYRPPPKASVHARRRAT